MLSLRLPILILFLFAAGLAVAAQAVPQQDTASQAPATQTSTPTPSASEAQRATADKELDEEKRQRMLLVVPDFLSVRNGHAAPLTAKQKFRLALADGIDPFDFAASAVDAGLEQEQGEFPAYGSGWTGYAKRFGAAYADDFDGELLSEAVFPSLLRQDPRYFRLGHGGLGQRLAYSLLSAVRCHGDNGNWQVNASGILGTYAAGAISNVYYPAADRGLGLTLQRGSIDIGETLLQSLASEFYPDISQALFHHHAKHVPSPTP